MNTRLWCVVFALLLWGCSSETAKKEEPDKDAPAAKPAAAEIWTVTEGIDAPESTYVDPKSGDIYVSIIGGMPDQKDGNGRIAKISADGKSVNAMWVTGLNAPKGIRSYEGTLWTTDIDEIISVDMTSGKITSHVKVKDAKFLNDTAVGSDGTVYVTDMMANRIYSVKGGRPRLSPKAKSWSIRTGCLSKAIRSLSGDGESRKWTSQRKCPGDSSRSI